MRGVPGAQNWRENKSLNRFFKMFKVDFVIRKKSGMYGEVTISGFKLF